MRKFIITICILFMIAGSLVHMFFGYTHRGRPGHAWGCDDAYISYRYARNFAEGKGLVYNESEKVEGYSNFLYVLLSTPLVMISVEYIYFLSCLLNICFLIAGFWLFQRHVKQYWGDRDSYIAGLLFAICPVLWVWTASGMETPLVLLLQIAVWILSDRLSREYDKRNFILLATVFLLLVLSRADGFVFPLIAVALLVLRRQYKTALLSLGVLIVVVGIYFVWRHAYYGYWLPNTYYAKVSGPVLERIKVAFKLMREVLFMKGFLIHFVLIIVLFFYGFWKTIKERDYKFLQIESGTFFVIGLLAYWFIIGGDVFVERFLIFSIPVGLFALPLSLKYFNDKLSGIGFPLVVLLFQLTPVFRDPNFEYRKNKYDQWVTLGKYFEQNHPGATLAIDAAGKVPYFSKLYTIDMLGLNEPRIAHMDSPSFALGHDKYNPEYVLTKQPDFVAAWGHPTLDMRFGLLQNMVTELGYELKYLVNCNKDSKPENVVDVEDATESEIVNIFKGGYQYFVLQKQ